MSTPTKNRFTHFKLLYLGKLIIYIKLSHKYNMNSNLMLFPDTLPCFPLASTEVASIFCLFRPYWYSFIDIKVVTNSPKTVG